MKKIVFVVKDMEMGGLQKVTSVIADSLASKFEVSILSVEQTPSFFKLSVPLETISFTERKLSWGIRKIITKFRHEVLRNSDPFWMQITDRQAESLLKKLEILNPDVIVLEEQMILLSNNLKEKGDYSIIGWIHNSFDAYFSTYFRNRKCMMEQSLKLCDKVVCLTEDDQRKFQLLNSDTVCIYNPLTIESQKISNLDNKSISFVGRLAIEQKGLDNLVKISKSLPLDWGIHIAGGGSRTMIKKFTQLVESQKAECIYYEGVKKDEALASHYINSSIYVMTSRWEGLALVLAEAMSFGLPIIAFEQTGANEVLKNGEYGIVIEQGNIIEFNKQLNRLIEDKKLREYYQKKSLERVKDFSIDSIAKQWIELIGGSD